MPPFKPLVFKLLLSCTSLLLLWGCQETAKDEPVYYTVERSDLPVYVSATGELAAKRSTKIRGPQGMRSAGIYETTLSDIVAEGTVVQKGEYVASLDRTEVANKLTNLRTELEKIQTQLEQAQIDTAIELRGLRDQLINNRFTLREKELQTQLNVYEAEAIKRQTQLELEKAERDFSQLEQNFTLKQEQAEAKIREIEAQRQQQLRELNILQELSADFNIHAPEDGMVIYARSWRGKVEPGSRITAWDPVVAELPDLNDMISKIYVNEVDISKVRKGQEVEVTLDAFAGLSYRGEVSNIANIGEQVRGYDAKVFEVEVQMLDLDSIMRPAMTTGNQILVDHHEKVLTIPLEALRTDTLSYVYLRAGRGLVRQQVETGALGTDKVIITAGLSPQAEILLSSPPEGGDYPWQSLTAPQSMTNE